MPYNLVSEIPVFWFEYEKLQSKILGRTQQTFSNKIILYF